MSWNKRRKRVSVHEVAVKETPVEPAAEIMNDEPVTEPEIQVVPEVRHGYWSQEDKADAASGASEGAESYTCSVCGYRTEEKTDTCPACQAVMDEVPATAEIAEPVEEKKEESMGPEESIQPGHAYWIHHRRRSESYAKGYYSLPVCDCSNCGYTASIEKKICPSCHCVMDAPLPDKIDAPYED
ncbi:MAG: hypothetical protein IIZ57_08520 [Solobacterium sp.]|nr:hypothetical protein [Solobacterium sp.]